MILPVLVSLHRGVMEPNAAECREVRQGNRAVRHRELPGCGEHGPQGRVSPVGTSSADWRLRIAVATDRRMKEYFAVSRVERLRAPPVVREGRLLDDERAWMDR
jgi:hypothetical protein